MSNRNDKCKRDCEFDDMLLTVSYGKHNDLSDSIRAQIIEMFAARNRSCGYPNQVNTSSPHIYICKTNVDMASYPINFIEVKDC